MILIRALFNYFFTSKQCSTMRDLQKITLEMNNYNYISVQQFKHFDEMSCDWRFPENHIWNDWF